MATIKIKFRASTVEDKEGTIYFSVTHLRVTRQINTYCKILKTDWDRTNSRLNLLTVMSRKDIELINNWDKIRFEYKRLQQIIKYKIKTEMPYTSEDIASEYIKRHKITTMFGFTLETIQKLKRAGNISNAGNYFSMLISFMYFRQGENIELKAMDSDIIEAYEGYLKHKAKRLSLNTISFYLRTLRSTLNRAIDKGLVQDKNIFKRVRTKMEKTAKRAISIEYVRKIKSLDLEGDSNLIFARDLFMFSFYTRGMSFVDIAYLKKQDIKNGEFTYRRSKTGQALRVALEPCMEEIIQRHSNQHTDYLLPIITKSSVDPILQYQSMRSKIGRNLKQVAFLAEIPLNITMYVARHTWASIAKNKNISISVISEAMGHESEITTQIYLASLDTAVIDDANRLIIGSV